MNVVVRIERYLSEDRDVARKNYPDVELQSALRIQYAAEVKQAVDDAMERGVFAADLLPWQIELVSFEAEHDVYRLRAHFETKRSLAELALGLQSVHYELGAVSGNFEMEGAS